MKQINFTVNKTDGRLIREIAKRAVLMASESAVDYELIDAEMDITAVHANACQLRLRKMLAAPDFDFAHDVFGIRRHLNRQTGELENHFVPRFAVN